MLAIEILVQAVVIVGPVPEQKRCRSGLACLMAPRDELGMFWRITNINSHRLVPSIRDQNKMRIDGRPESRNKIGQRIAEVLVFATAEPMTYHHNATAKDVVFRIEG